MKKFNAADIYRTRYDDPLFVIDKWLHVGMTLLSGSPKLGNSFLALQKALAVEEGGLLFNQFQATPGRMLYLDFENGLSRIHRRLHQMSVGQQALNQIDFVTEFPNDAQFGEGAEHLLSAALEQQRYSLVILDTLRKCQPAAPRGDFVKFQYEQSRLLSKLSEKHAVAILGITHNRKQHSESGVEMVSGSSGFGALQN
ncbi:MAG: helicase RepA family protein [Acidobacteriota bacterium]|nr:helicase RepA family protein [Acidobacteriota bacterium]